MLKPVKASAMYAGRLSHEDDLYESLSDWCCKTGVRYAWVNALGAVSRLAFLYYDQQLKKYLKSEREENLEILNCTGNISLKEGKPFVHMHITCSDHEGRVWGGHLAPGTKVFACEVGVWTFEGDKSFQRERDDVTGLHLWPEASRKESCNETEKRT